MWQCNGIVYYVTKRLSCWLPFFCRCLIFDAGRNPIIASSSWNYVKCAYYTVLYYILYDAGVNCPWRFPSRGFFIFCVLLSPCYFCFKLLCFFLFCFVSSLCVSLWTTRTLVTHISITDRVQYISRPKSGSHLLTNYRRSSSFRLSLFFLFHPFFLAFLFFVQLSLLFFRVSILILLDKNRNWRQAQSPTRT